MEPVPAFWRDLVQSREYLGAPEPLFAPLGRADGETVAVDLHLLRHLLICGDAEAGKTTLVHAILNSLLMRTTPAHLRLIIIDAKGIEYQAYDALSFLLTPVIADAKKGLLALRWLAKEYERRISVLKDHGMRSIEAYHRDIVRPAVEYPKNDAELPEAMPYIVTVIDELSIPTALFKRDYEAALTKLAHSARAAGIHLIVTTSRADARSLPVTLRDVFAARIVFHTSAAMSRALVGESGAEHFTAGEAFFRKNAMTKPIRFRTAYIDEDESDAALRAAAERCPKEEIDPGLVPSDYFWREEPRSVFEMMAEEGDDDRFLEAVQAVQEAGKASTSYLQRKLGIGYSRAAHLIDLLEERGIIGPGKGAEPRDVL